MESILKVKVIPNGPLQVTGVFEIDKQDGETEKHEGSTYLCRCGHSGKKPYCDGSHRKQGFQG
ncbi:MAG: CDGSH iron-sulfur domain-containing protein [Proteiniphilum sp.]|jgi:CDGSH-type Zn-finger protein|nr:CDGSH iron-sulfur domain-containing protein [Proteiniphilum sp.]MDD2938598.1 CDGSH iron-sulfur domain-containing protein [Proteiniphilum sp.]MDD3076811.1 CDGSH iron-sulfur domain-containing protein [Proteiniphilum sp.]MDD3780328.1 CDGSH iron-sulfur domain-containing protein [Proteiniphilum sp.]MDD3956723.1 CDGSH iron-sulfur domain-containing protein [Proteiniphilum sp.]